MQTRSLVTMSSALGFHVCFACVAVASSTATSLLSPIATSNPEVTLFPRPSVSPAYPPVQTVVSGPKQTNKFWENWCVGGGEALAIISAPYALKQSGGEIWVSHGIDWDLHYGMPGGAANADRVRWYITHFMGEFALGAKETLGVFRAAKEGVFGADFEVLGPVGTNYKITYPIYSGMAYVTGRYEGGITPKVVIAVGTSQTSKVADGIWKVVNVRGVEFRVYVLNSDGSFVDSSYSMVPLTNPDGSTSVGLNKQLDGWVRIAHVVTAGDAAVLDGHATIVLTDMDMELLAGGIMQYKYSTVPMAGANFLHFAYPHHLPLLPNERAGLAPSKTPTKGWMTAVLGNTWILEVDLEEAQSFDWLPQGQVRPSLETTVRAEVLASWEFLKPPAVWQAETIQDSYYWSGKGLQKVATVCLLLEKFFGSGDSRTQACADVLGSAFECYYKPRTQMPDYCSSGPAGIYYDPVWGGIPSQSGYSEWACWDFDFGNGCYNDHHYHYGYFVVSAAILMKFRPGLTSTGFVDWVNMLIRDTTNPSALDTYFPRFRAFDFFDWHSWSRGLVASPDGKDQESTSEEVNLLYGLILWGKVTGNPSVKGLGEMMVSLEMMSIKQYFFMMDGNTNAPAGFVKNHVTGIYFQNKVDYATWFGWNEAFIHGIQMLPLTPPLQKTRDPAFCTQEWDEILYKASFPTSEPDYKWMSVIRTGSLAIIKPMEAFDLLLNTPQNDTVDAFDSGLTKGWALYWTAIDPNVTEPKESLLLPIGVEKPNSTLFPLPTVDPGYPVANSVVSGPKQTNKFWANWVVGGGEALAIISAPWALKRMNGAVWVSHGLEWDLHMGTEATNGPDRVQWYTTPYVGEFGLGAMEPLEVFQAVKEGLFGVHFEAGNNTGYKITYPIYNGMSYVSAHYEGGITPKVGCFGGCDAAQITKFADGIWKFMNSRGAEFRVYVLNSDGSLVDSSYTFTTAGVLNKPLDDGWVRLGHVVTTGDAAVLDSHATTVLCDVDVEVKLGVLEYNFTTIGAGSDLMHFAYAHHLPLLPNERAYLTRSKAPTKGWMTAVLGDTWTMKVDLAEAQFFDWLPQGEVRPSLASTVEAEVLASWEFLKPPAVWQAETLQASFYWSGKGLQKIGTICLLLEKFYGSGDSKTQACADVLGSAFECYYKPRNMVPDYCSSGPDGIYYDPVWGGAPSKLGYDVVACWDLDFGNGCYNDHHYHYGYFVVSAAILIKFRPDLKDIGLVDWVNVLIRDTTNPSALDTYFPRFRAFDFFDWHSWSRGLVPSPDGKDQESTSEEVNLLYGMILWGKVTGNPSVQGLGEMMVSLEMMSIKQYFFMMDGNPNAPAGFVKNHVTGIYFQNKVDYSTWFGWNEAFIHGIQMLPLTPPLQKTRDIPFCSQEWDQILYKASFPTSEPDYKWMSVIRTGSLAIIKPLEAFDLLLSTPQTAGNDLYDSGLSKGWALYWTAIQPGIPPPTTVTATGTMTTTETAAVTATMTMTMTASAAAGGFFSVPVVIGLVVVGVLLPAIAGILYCAMQQGQPRGDNQQELTGPSEVGAEA